jgi:putative oxidoreductase
MNGRVLSVQPNLRRSSFLSGAEGVVASASSVVCQDLAQTRTSARSDSAMNALNIIGQTLAEHEMVAHGIPGALVPTLIVAARALQLIAGLGLILGIYPRIAALALLLFLIPATLMAHAFWLAMGTSLYMVQLINFFKNVSMAGGLIFIIATGSQPTLLPRPARADSNPCA